MLLNKMLWEKEGYWKKETDEKYTVGRVGARHPLSNLVIEEVLEKLG